MRSETTSSSPTRAQGDGVGSVARVPARRRAGGDRLRPHDGAGRPASVRPGGRRGDAQGARHRADRRHDRHRRGRARRGADALHRRDESAWRIKPNGSSRAVRRSRHRRRSARRAPTSARPASPTPSPCSRRRSAAGCCTRPTSTWRSSSSGPARSTWSTSTRRCATTCGRSPAASAGRSTSSSVVVLDRPRHEKLIADIRATGARIRLIGDGDLSAGIAAAVAGTGVHAVMGIGGAPEGVLAAAAMRCLNGEIFARLVVTKPEHEERCRAMGITDRSACSSPRISPRAATSSSPPPA